MKSKEFHERAQYSNTFAEKYKSVSSSSSPKGKFFKTHFFFNWE